jgi:hypothetical protein
MALRAHSRSCRRWSRSRVDAALAESFGVGDGGVLSASVVVINQAGQIGDAITVTGPDGVLDRVEDELGAHAGRGAPADDASGVGIDQVSDQQGAARGRHRAIDRVPGNAETCSDRSDRHPINHQASSAHMTACRDSFALETAVGLVSWRHTRPTRCASIAADPQQQDRGPPAERNMRQPTHHGVPQHTAATASMAPVIRFHNATFQHRVVTMQLLTAGPQTQVIQPAECGQVSRAEGSVTHVEVFQVGRVRTSIIENLDPYPATDALSATPSTAMSRIRMRTKHGTRPHHASPFRAATPTHNLQRPSSSP